MSELGEAGETEGTLLGGRIIYRQKSRGFRTGIEPVFLAACVPARPGDQVVEAGTGAGAGLLCLTARVPGLIGTGVERDADMAALARRNLAANGVGTVAVETADVGDWRSGTAYQHALANPPWHQAGQASPEAGRQAAKQARAGLLRAWAVALARGLSRRGTLSLIIPALAAAEGTAALIDANCAEISVIPLWPHAGVAAKLVILQGVREGKGGTTLHPGIVLHEAGGSYTKEAENILRYGAGVG